MKKSLSILLAVLLVAAAATGALFFKQRNDLRNELAAAERQMTELNHTVLILNEEIDGLRETLSAAQNRNKMTTRALAGARAENLELGNRHRATLEELAKARYTANRLAAAGKKLSARISFHEETAKEQLKRFHLLSSEKEQLLSEQAELKRLMAADRLNLRREMDLRDRAAADVEAQRLAVENDLADALTALRSLKARGDELQARIEAGEKAAGEREQLLANLRAEKNALAHQNNTLESARSALSHHIEKIAVRCQVEQFRRDTTIVSMEARNRSLEKALAAGKETIDALKGAGQKLLSRVSTVEKAAATYELQLSDEKMAYRKLADAYKTATAIQSKLEQKIAAQRSVNLAELADRDQKVAQLEKRIRRKSFQLTGVLSKNQELENRLTEKHQAVNAYRQQLDSLRSEIPTLEDRLNDSRVRYISLRHRLDSAKDQQLHLQEQTRQMRTTYDTLVTELRHQIGKQQAFIQEYQEKLKVTFLNRILFGFSKVTISDEGKIVLRKVADVLQTIPAGRIKVVGYTDSVPIARQFRYRYPSNWELSSARAAAVVRYLEREGGLAPETMEAAGHGRHHPIGDNDTEKGRALNRRVEIVIMPELITAAAR